MTAMRGKLRVCAVLLLLHAGSAYAQSYPVKPIRVVIPYAAGASTDALVRITGAKMNENWGVQVIADNRPGAGGMLGGEIAAKSAPDGYTLLSVVSSHVVHPSLFKAMSYDPTRDFTAIILQGRAANMIVVHPSLPVYSIKELVALARARPGQLSFGSATAGGSNHLTGELFKIVAKIDLQHIPYKGGAPNATAVAAGEIPLTISLVPTIANFVKAGRVRPVAITSGKRDPAYPQVPTLVESGFPGFESYEWWALLAPTGVPRDIVAKLNAEVDRVMKLPDVRDRVAALGIEYTGSTPEQADAYVKSERERWAKVVKAAGIKQE